MFQAFDPARLLYFLKIDHERVSRPVELFNFIERDGNFSNRCKQYFLFDEEWQDDNEYKWFRDHYPIAMFSGVLPLENWNEKYDRVFFPFYMIKTLESNRNFDRITKVNVPLEKPFIADVLLGQAKTHRWQILNRLKEQNLESRCLINFQDGKWSTLQLLSKEIKSYPDWGFPKAYRSPALDVLENEHVNNYIKTANKFEAPKTIKEYGDDWFCRLIPNKIYDNSWYTIVAETHTSNRFFFATEKIGKPLCAGRIFLVASGKHYLKTLRSLGFQTFDDIIDESYDEITDEFERVDAMLKAFYQLIKEDPVKIYQKALPRLLHNQKMLEKEHLNKEARNYLLGFIRGVQ